MQQRIAIIGAGVGGLAAAIACQRHGIEFTIFDHAEHPLTGGFALTLWPNAIRALKQLGVFLQRPTWMQSLHHGELRTAQNERLYTLPIDWLASVYDETPTCVLRADLTTFLHQALGSPVIQRAHIEGIHSDTSGVALTCADGRTICVDGVIAADGIHSKVRQHVFGDRRRTASYTAWRGVARGAEIEVGTMCEYVGRGVRFGYANIRPSLTYWFATMNHQLMKSDLSDDESWAHVARHLCHFPTSVRRCIEMTDSHEILKSPVQDVAPGTPMSLGRIALLGDAAHAITPNLGLGACLALEDAAQLARCIQTEKNLITAFQSYAAARRRRVAQVSRMTRELGFVLQLENAALTKLRNTLVQQLPKALARQGWRTILG